MGSFLFEKTEKFITNMFIYNDAPLPWSLGFQDGSTPGFEGISTLHNTIFFL